MARFSGLVCSMVALFGLSVAALAEDGERRDQPLPRQGGGSQDLNTAELHKIEKEYERIWFLEDPEHATPEKGEYLDALSRTIHCRVSVLPPGLIELTHPMPSLWEQPLVTHWFDGCAQIPLTPLPLPSCFAQPKPTVEPTHPVTSLWEPPYWRDSRD